MNGDVRDFLIDLFFGTLTRHILKHYPVLRIHSANFEVCLPVAAYEPTEALTLVKNADLSPEIHEAIG